MFVMMDLKTSWLTSDNILLKRCFSIVLLIALNLMLSLFWHKYQESCILGIHSKIDAGHA
jgi:hypothetical protein